MNINNLGLELTWTGKAAAQRVARQTPFHALEPVSSHGIPGSGNVLVQGDNLLALKSLMPFYKGQVKCIFIDPPYNTGSAFEHYDDKLQHSQWLCMMLPRLELLKDLLAMDGSIWVTIDDNEGHYLKVLMDEVFGRDNFVANVVWQKKYAGTNDSKYLSDIHDHVLVYAKTKSNWKPNLLLRSDELNAKYTNPDNDSRGAWNSTNLSVKTFSEKNYYPIVGPTGNEFYPPPTRCWVVSKEKYQELLADKRIWFGGKGDSRPYKKTFLSEVQQGTVPLTLWLHSDAGHNIEAKGELRKLFPNSDDLFATPKPERLLQRILHIATNPQDLVLDSFLGSGTTAAVAHKMNRRWIGIEMGDHAHTHCLPRLTKVIAGEQGGISAAVGWTGGGGFQFMRLGPAILTAQRRIAPDISFAALAALVWHLHTGQPADHAMTTALLGVHEGTACYLIYNGILGDIRPEAGNVLTESVYRHLMSLHPHAGPCVVYGEATLMGPARRAALGLVFKQWPYDLKQIQTGAAL